MMKFLTSAIFATAAIALPRRQGSVASTTCNGKVYEYLSLAGYGFTAPNSRDKFGDTAGGIGSSAAIDAKTWTLHSNGTYTALLYALPDRGWNTEGTLNYQPRVHKFHIVFNPDEPGPEPNLHLFYLDSVRFFADANTPFTGLDPNVLAPYITTTEGTMLPSVTYIGDGFGGDGPGGSRPSLDSEGLVLMPDGSMYVSDEYGDYIYHFTTEGELLAAIPAPDAFIPIRNGSVSFSAASPPRYDPDLEVIPEDPDSGRANNQGFEGLTRSQDGRFLFALTQSALIQDGGSESGGERRWARLVKMDLSDLGETGVPPVVAQYVVPLPVYEDDSGELSVAAQSEIKFISDTQFFVLARDGRGRASDDTESLYRHVDIFDIANATDVNGRVSVAPDGELDGDVVAATYCTFLDYNINSELAKFGLHNGGGQDTGLLNEKWESLVLAPVNPKSSSKAGVPEEYYLFTLSDNDFITQDGYMKGGEFPYSDESGYDLLNQVLVFRVRLPCGSDPLTE